MINIGAELVPKSWAKLVMVLSHMPYLSFLVIDSWAQLVSESWAQLVMVLSHMPYLSFPPRSSPQIPST